MSTEKNAPGPTSTGRAEPPRQGGTELQDTPSLPAWCVKGASFIDAQGNPWLVVHTFSAEDSRGESGSHFLPLLGPRSGADLVQMVTRQPCTVWSGSPTITSARDILPPEGELIEAAELLARQGRAAVWEPRANEMAKESHAERAAFVRETAARILAQRSHLPRVGSEEELVSDCVCLSAALLLALDQAGYGFE